MMSVPQLIARWGLMSQCEFAASEKCCQTKLPKTRYDGRRAVRRLG